MKLTSFAAIALTCFLTTVSARIQLAAPVNPVSGGRSTVTWTHDTSDPAQFILMLQLASDSWATGQFWEFTQTKNDKLDVVFLNTDPYVINTKSGKYGHYVLHRELHYLHYDEVHHKCQAHHNQQIYHFFQHHHRQNQCGQYRHL
ncbi:hypothetical protein EST38_g5650 [Candolleomyces aberdarensis]|uniref:Uncharacterized protein n=1 Tax=Candolleomyces aberdarensis TaxID=2316362 RepID=A0A4Q2DJI1_9AGAR|nr:hypothetical protein EST38_g5650 [Candolleomyces aberdarensis]